MASTTFRYGIGALLAAQLALAGCQTPVAHDDLAEFGTATAAISRQADRTFAESNRLARAASAGRFVASGDVGLSEDKFVVAVAPADVAAWQQAFAALEDYADGLASLTDDTRAPAFSDAVAKVGRRLRDGSVGAPISPAVGAGFASLAGAILAARQDRAARRILAAADPAIQQITGGMADAIGATDGEGLRGTVRVNWIDLLREVRSAYAAAAARHDTAAQQSLVERYLAGLDRRDAQLRRLAALRGSIVALGTAHAAAAANRPASARTLLAALAARADETRRLYDSFEADASEPR